VGDQWPLRYGGTGLGMDDVVRPNVEIDCMILEIIQLPNL